MTLKAKHRPIAEKAHRAAQDALDTFGVSNHALKNYLAMELFIWWCDGGIAAIDRQQQRIEMRKKFDRDVQGRIRHAKRGKKPRNG